MKIFKKNERMFVKVLPSNFYIKAVIICSGQNFFEDYLFVFMNIELYDTI